MLGSKAAGCAGDPAGRGTGNSRNGYWEKTVLTEDGELDFAAPRDRNGTFGPIIVPKSLPPRMRGAGAGFSALAGSLIREPRAAGVSSIEPSQFGR